MSFNQVGVGDRVSAAAPFGYALLSPPLAGRSGRVRCAVLLRDCVALRFRGLLAFFTSPGTWATSLKILSLGSPAWDVVVSPFTDVFAGFRLRVLAVGRWGVGFFGLGRTCLGFSAWFADGNHQGGFESALFRIARLLPARRVGALGYKYGVSK